MRRVTVCIGTRPELIKLYPVIKQLEARDDVELRVVFTAQHRELLDDLAAELGVVADVDLDVMRPGQSLEQVQRRLLEGLDRELEAWTPDVVVAQGDTMSVYAAAMSAFLKRIPFAHVEAGLRSGQRFDPFPEEGLRRAISALTTLHFAPTVQASSNLLKEGIGPEDIFVTGNTAIDTLLEVVAQGQLDLPDGVDCTRRLVLVTLHRRENQGAPMKRICRAIRVLAKIYPDIEWVFPVHPSPAVKDVVKKALGEVTQVRLLEPLGYKAFVACMNRASFILTDSGGVQEEAPALCVPVLVARETTERPEGLRCGVARLVGTQEERIVEAAMSILDGRADGVRVGQNPYGDGLAAARIAQVLAQGSCDDEFNFNGLTVEGMRCAS